MSCECRTDKRTFLNIGKAVMVRNRLQWHLKNSAWAWNFMDHPHNHLIQISVWYLPKEHISVAEKVLIDLLEPTQNKYDRGYGDRSLWEPRLPDLDGFLIEDIEPDTTSAGKIRAAASPIKNTPGVYAWWFDLGAQAAAVEELLPSIFVDGPSRQAVVERLAILKRG